MATRIPHGTAHPPAPQPTCLGRTCLQWRADGELIEDDWDLVLQRLGMVDELAATISTAA